MTLQLYNSLTRVKETFKPIDPDHIGIYVCGPTVYDFAHLGNARPVVVFDVLYRLLQRHYPKVTYVRNITDVDDKIMDAAKKSGEPIEAITSRTIQAFHEDMAALNALPPTIEPRATQHIAQMIAMIATLIDKKHAYAAEGHVLFSVASMPDYGELARKKLDEMRESGRVEKAPYKKDESDFVLWKPSADDQPGWDSPWGRGRPGWHIECSAMAAQHLGVTFDIHGGGLDLIFPHHENEIAQSRCAHNSAALANYWMHNGFLMVDGKKMSKSLGNFHTVRDLLAHAPGEALRLALLGTHYRSPLDFSIKKLEEAKDILDKWYGALRTTAGIETIDGPLPQAFIAAMDDDLNTPEAIKEIHALTNNLNRAATSAEQISIRSQLLKAGESMGLLKIDPEDWFKWQPAGAQGLEDDAINALVEARTAARIAKDFVESDRIRQLLLDQGVVVEDRPGGKVEWRREQKPSV